MGQGRIEVPAEGEGALGALRLATAAAHARIESVLGLDGAFSLAHYGRVLQGFDSFLCVWEPAVAAALPPALRPWFEARRRWPLLLGDLAALKLPRTRSTVALPPLANPAAALGSLYVLEGSALGGQVIAQRLRRRHGLGPADGAAYFIGWAGRTLHLWRDFQQVLAREVADAAGREAACSAAVATFEALTATFQEGLHEPAAA